MRKIMNIEIANRLVNLRKSNNLSQEALAEKLGISRQAVSKWERAEASPDTDNLILLARLYGVSLDDLLRTEDEIPMPEEETQEVFEAEERGNAEQTGSKEDKSWKDYQYEDSSKKEYVHVGFDGIHVKDEDSEVHVGWKGIHVIDRSESDMSAEDSPSEVHIDKNGVFVDGEKYDKHIFANQVKAEFPYVVIVFIVYIILGVLYKTWGIGLLLFLTIPVIESVFKMIRKRRVKEFNYAVLATIIFFLLGYFKGLWHPGWVMFLTIPVYYSLVDYFSSLWATHKKNKEL